MKRIFYALGWGGDHTVHLSLSQWNETSYFMKHTTSKTLQRFFSYEMSVYMRDGEKTK